MFTHTYAPLEPKQGRCASFSCLLSRRSPSRMPQTGQLSAYLSPLSMSVQIWPGVLSSPTTVHGRRVFYAECEWLPFRRKTRGHFCAAHFSARVFYRQAGVLGHRPKPALVSFRRPALISRRRQHSCGRQHYCRHPSERPPLLCPRPRHRCPRTTHGVDARQISCRSCIGPCLCTPVWSIRPTEGPGRTAGRLIDTPPCLRHNENARNANHVCCETTAHWSLEFVVVKGTGNQTQKGRCSRFKYFSTHPPMCRSTFAGESGAVCEVGIFYKQLMSSRRDSFGSRTGAREKVRIQAPVHPPPPKLFLAPVLLTNKSYWNANENACNAG